MAGFQKIYTSENEYLYDLGKTTGYFDEEYYNLAKESGSDYQYLQMMASLKQTGVSDTFDPVLYNKLSGEERFNYLATENFMDKASKDYSISSQYFKQREKQIQNEEIYASLNGFEKTMNSIGGWLGNTFLQVGGIVEGLIDAGATLVGAFGSEEFKKDVKEFVASDTTGYNAAQASMNDWINKYTFIDKNVVTQAINDVTTGIVRMVPMIVGGVLAPYTGGVSAKIGTSIYYASMAGNTSEQAIVANPNINYGNLLVYTAGSVGLEAMTEWASGKLFGDDLISSLMKGQKYAPTGTLVKTIAKNFGTEALEEAVAELFGSMMYAELVTGDVNDIASIGDIFYAAIIGGLTGAVMSGGRIATTKRMVVTKDGQLKYRSDLSKAELKTAKKLKLSESWGLQNLIHQSQQALSTPDNVTQLMAKTGKSVSQLLTENAVEYEKAVAKDTEFKTQQAKAILDLANLMSTIGVEQFIKSAELLKNNADLATEYVNNFLNHTDVANKKASEVFSATYTGKSFTPTAIPSKPNRALAEALRQAFPQLKVVFGTFGSEDGLPVRAINKGETYLFLDENMVSRKGYQQVLHETIRYQLADQLMQEINILDNAEANGVVKLVTDLDVDYDKLTKEQKLSIAQILCFDPVNSRRLFKGANKTHAKIFNYITDQSEYIKKFGRQTEANKMRYHDLLEIRNMYIKNIAETISNNEDVQTAKEQYNLTDEETKTKIIDKTENTILNDTIAVMRQNLDKNVIARQEAIEDLLQNRVETNKSVPFDWSNLYNEEYYNENWVAQIKQQQQTQDFHEALRAHLIASHKVDFSIIEHSTLVDTITNSVSIDKLNKLAETLFTKEYLDTNPDLQSSVADALYTMVQTEDTDADSIVVKDNQIEGTGELRYFKGDVYERFNDGSKDQDGRIDFDTGRPEQRQISDNRRYEETSYGPLKINEQSNDTLEDYQKELVSITQEAYGLTLHFYRDSAQNIEDPYAENLQGFYIRSTKDIFVQDDATRPMETLIETIRHEVVHFLIYSNDDAYQTLLTKIKKIDKESKDKPFSLIKGNISRGYNNLSDSVLDEESVVALISQYADVDENSFREKSSRSWYGKQNIENTMLTYAKINTAIEEFYESAVDGKEDLILTQPLLGSDTDIRKQIVQKGKVVKNLFVEKPKKLTDFPTTNTVVRPTIGKYHATWTQDRLNDLIERSGSTNPNYANSYAAYMTIDQFLTLSTTSDTGRTNSISAVKEDYERQSDVNYSEILKDKDVVVPHLIINADTMRVEDHDGRHRLIGLQKQDIYWVAVKIDFEGNSFDKYNAKIYETLTLKPQEFPEGTRQNYTTDVHTVVPLNESNRTNLENLFIKERLMSTAGFRFSLSKQNKQDTSIQQKINKAESPKQIADVITAIVEAAPLEMSETKGYGDEGTRMYKKTSNEMRRKYASLWSKITQDNYDKVRNELVKSDYEYADEALLIFDRFTRAYSQLSTKFDAETKEKILKNASKKQTIAAISQGLQSAELANEHSFGEISAKFEEDGYKVKVSDQTVARYVPEMANKKEFVKQLDKEISDIEEQIKTAETDSDAAELNNQLDKTIEKRIVMSEGTNEEIMDWVIKNEDIVTKASKLQKEVFEQMVEKGELAQKKGKKAVTILVDEKTGLPKPFPKTTQFIEKNVKRLKSFRMWAMLTSPVSWVRNWVGNSGMTALDSMTNSLEKFIASKQPKMTEADLAKLKKQYKELASKEKPTDADKIKLVQLSNQMGRYYDFKFVDTKASKELRTQIAKDYKDVIQQILNGEDVKYESSAEKAAAITRAGRKITQASQNANLGQKLWAACQSMTDWGLNTGWFGDNAVVVNSLVKNFANMVESNKTYLLKSLKTEYGNDGRRMSDARKKLVEKALNSQKSIDIVNAMSKSDVSMFMDSCKQRTFEQYFKNSNWLSQWASNLSKKHPIAASLTSLVLPFPKVAANILSMAYKYSPLGFLSAARQWSVVKQMDAEGYAGVRDAFARAKAGRTTAQATVGSFMMLAGLILAALGFVDIDEDDYLGPSLKMGDFKISLSNLAPSMTTFSVGSAMLWAWKNDKSAALQALNVLYDNTLLGNIENVFKYGSPDKYIENLSINYFSQYVPAMLKLFSKFTTNQEMIDKSGSYWEKLGKTFASGIPFVANALPKKINPYTGEVLTGTGSQNVFFNFIEALSPLDFRSTSKPATQKEAERLGAESSGLSGTFKVNDIEYNVDKVTYGKYRANYIEENFEKILSGKQMVTVEDENGKRITTTYNKLNDKQKKNVINRLYTDATSMTKIKWWTDQGNTYVVTDRDLYNEYRKMFSNIVYKKNWSKSKFVES